MPPPLDHTTRVGMAGSRGGDIARRDLMRLLQGGSLVAREALKLEVRNALRRRASAEAPAAMPAARSPVRIV